MSEPISVSSVRTAAESAPQADALSLSAKDAISSAKPVSAAETISRAEMDAFFDVMQPFKELMMYYECAILEVRTKVEVLDKEFSVRYQRDPVESIKTRLKSPLSIVEKMRRKGLPLRLDTLERSIHDVAGIRIVCSFVDDIYAVANLLTSQDDITLLETKDYIKNPKPNGYRSLHLLVGIPIFLSSGKKEMCVEVQIRTVAMDFWASTEHKIKYKKDIADRENVTNRLRICAEKVAALDLEMQEIGREIAREQNELTGQEEPFRRTPLFHDEAAE